MDSPVLNSHNQYQDIDDRQTLKKTDTEKTKFLYSIGDNDEIPTCKDLLEFFDKKLNVAQTTIKDTVLDAKICRIEAGNIIVDMNLKNFGKLPKEEIRIGITPLNVNIGDVIKVVAESIDAKKNSPYIKVSWEKARRITLWEKFEESQRNSVTLQGSIISETRGGYYVNIQGVRCFCPGSHLDFKTLERSAIEEMKSNEQPFLILSMDKGDKNKKDSGKKGDDIVVSRREVLNKIRMEIKDIAISQINLGDIIEGTVKSIAPYGCFVNLAINGKPSSVDGLLHVNDIAWEKCTHPSENISIGQSVKVKVIGLIPGDRKISLGLKQLQVSPWENITSKFKIGSIVKGVIKNTTDYGCFVEIDKGIEGLVHISEMSWFKRNLHVSVGQELDVMILTIDEEKTRIGLSIKQCTENPWVKFSEKNKTGSIMQVTIKKHAEYGLFVDLGTDLEGLVHISDVAWNDAQKIMNSEALGIGRKINVKILSIDIEKSRIALGIKQCERDYFEEFLKKVSVGHIIKNCIIMGSWNNKIEIEIPEAKTIVSLDINTLPQIGNQDRQSIYTKDRTIDCKVAEVDRERRKITLVGMDYELKNDKSATEEQQIEKI